MTDIGDLWADSEKRQIPDAEAENKRNIACGRQSNPYRTSAPCADKPRARQDLPGGLELTYQRPEPGLDLTRAVTAP